jgi:hypothetical protein
MVTGCEKGIGKAISTDEKQIIGCGRSSGTSD